MYRYNEVFLGRVEAQIRLKRLKPNYACGNRLEDVKWMREDAMELPSRYSDMYNIPVYRGKGVAASRGEC
ncbi:MAG: hypothetical protein ACE5Z5_03695 [Candidatus Bathyarchaeia archaeon]